MKSIFVVAALAATSLSACATVTRGQNTVLEIETTPGGAQVRTSNNMACESTPCGLKMARKSDNVVVTITKDGYKELKVTLATKVAGAGGAGMAGNVLVGGLIGAGVDVATGAMLDLVPNPLRVTLEKVDPVPVEVASEQK
jgi:hypothetical protein